MMCVHNGVLGIGWRVDAEDDELYETLGFYESIAAGTSPHEIVLEGDAGIWDVFTCACKFAVATEVNSSRSKGDVQSAFWLSWVEDDVLSVLGNRDEVAALLNDDE